MVQPTPIEDEVTLGQLIDRSIESYNEIKTQPTTNEEITQNNIVSALSDLSLASSLISRLSILSTNETLEDIHTNDLRCLAVDCLRGMLYLLLKTKTGAERKTNLESAKEHLIRFVSIVESYEVIPTDQIDRFKGPLNTISNPAIRRESKIAQFKLEKELEKQLATMSNRHSHSSNEDQSDSREHEDRRSKYLFWLRLLYLKAHQELSSIDLELDILGQGSQMCDLPSARQSESDPLWRLDKPREDRSGPLVSPSGKVLRPFTILPSRTNSAGTTNRIKLRSEVFRADWNLPTMSIDDYLEEQKQMGNFLSGGGPDQASQETQTERDKRESEEDNMQGDIKSEELRLKAVAWNEYTDRHRKGEGNMMNRG